MLNPTQTPAAAVARALARPLADALALARRLAFAGVLASAVAASVHASPASSTPDGESIGLYPLALPPGQEALQARLGAQLHEGAASLPRVRAFDLIPRGACLPDEGGCLAAAARSAGLSQIISAQVTQKAKGYGIVLRLFDAKDGAALNTHDAEVAGGPLDLAGSLEHGVCRLLGAAPCTGMAAVRTNASGCKVGAFSPKIFVDGVDQGALPLPKPLVLTVGRHSLRAGSGDERKVRISYARETRLACEVRAGLPELFDDVPDVTPPPAAQAPAAAPALAVSAKEAPKLTPREAGGRLAIATGVVLLAVSAGVGFWAHAEGAALDDRYHSGALTDADKAGYSSMHTAGAVSLGAAIAGGAAVLGGALLLVLPAPSASPPDVAGPGRQP